MPLSFLSLFLLLAQPQVEVFKNEKTDLQSAVDALVAQTGAQVMLGGSRAAYIEGYGIIVTLVVAFEPPQNIFSTPKKPAEVRALVSKRRKEVQEKLTSFVKQRVATTDSLASSDSLAIVIHVLNTNPADVPNLPIQILIAAKKDSPQTPLFREF